MWFYLVNNQQNGPIPEQAVVDLIQNGAITPDTYLWREGMADWMPAGQTELNHHFTAADIHSVISEGTASVVESQPQLANTLNEFKDISSLTRRYKLFVIVFLILAGLLLISTEMEIQALRNFEKDVYKTDQNAQTAADKAGFWNALISLAYILAFIVTFVFLLIWIYRANYNFRKLGVTDLNHTPGWSVGWFFIPFANIWKPYYVMSEIYLTGQKSKSPAIVALWWFSIVISNFIDHLANNPSTDSSDIHVMVYDNHVLMVSIGLAIVHAICALIITSRVRQVQLTMFKNRCDENNGMFQPEGNSD